MFCLLSNTFNSLVHCCFKCIVDNVSSELFATSYEFVCICFLCILKYMLVFLFFIKINIPHFVPNIVDEALAPDMIFHKCVYYYVLIYETA